MADERIDRRAFLALGNALMLTGAAGCSSGALGRGWIAAGPIAGLSTEDWIGREVTLFPALADPRITVPGVGDPSKARVYLRLSVTEGDEVVALSDRCTHLGCPVHWVAASRRFICPCHGGVMGFDGRPLGGPVRRPLDRFETRVRDGVVYLGRRIEAPGPGTRSSDPP